MKPQLILARLETLTRAEPDYPAIYEARQGPDQVRTITRADLWSRAERVARALSAAGVNVGDCIAVWLPNWVESVTIQLAALSLGAHVVGINTRYNKSEVAHVLRTAQPRAVVLAHGFMDSDVSGRWQNAVKLAGFVPDVCFIVGATDEDLTAHLDTYNVGSPVRDLSASSSVSGLADGPGENLMTAFTTSGSTGYPKLAAHTAFGIADHLTGVVDHLGLRPGHVVLGALPLAGVFGFTSSYAAWYAGASVLLEPIFDDDGVLGDMARHGVSHVAAADDLMGRIVTAWERQPVQLKLKVLGLADFVGRSHEVARWAQEQFGATVTGVYGSSEVMALAMMWPDATGEPLRWQGGGLPVTPGAAVRVVSTETGEAVAVGDTGEIQYKGPNVVATYLGRPDYIHEVITDGGWFRTGDVGRAVEDGHVEYICRTDDAMRLRGFLVSPGEIESQLLQHPSVGNVKVVGATTPSGEQIAIAYVVLTGQSRASDGPASNERQLVAWCEDNIAKFKVPRHIRVLDEMPTTSGTNGIKIRASELRKMAEREFG